MRFILASSSPRRREIIAQMIGSFELIKPQIDETQGEHETPLDYVRRLSEEKAQAVADMLQEQATILAADTIVILAADTIGIEQNGEILGKPVGADDARAMLKRLRNRPHKVCTAFTLRNGTKSHTEIVSTTVHMRDYSDDEIDAYIATGDPFDKAGSYAIQHRGFHPVREIKGSYSNVVGLPADEVRAALEKMSIPTLNPPEKAISTTRIGHELLAFLPMDTPQVPEDDSHVPLVWVMIMVERNGKYLWHWNPNRNQWEMAAGGIEPNEHPDDTARRELFEETSQIARSVSCHGLFKMRLMPDKRVEYGVLYSATIAEMQVFVPNEETSELIWWNCKDNIEGDVGDISILLLDYLR
jgi:MAF protein